MPGRTKKVEVAGVQVTARELSVEEIYHWLGGLESRFDTAMGAPAMPDAIGAGLFDSVTLDDLYTTTTLDEATWRAAYPSEIEGLIAVVQELNPNFFAFRARMGAILSTLVEPRPASQDEPSQADYHTDVLTEAW